MEVLLQEYGVNPEVELYDILKHASLEERNTLCKTEKYKALCHMLMFDDYTYKNPGIPLQAYGAGAFKLILNSFPDFSSGLDFIQGVKSGFIYTQEFQNYVKGFLKIEETIDDEGDEDEKIVNYTLGDLSYEVEMIGEKFVRQEWFKNGKLHRKNYPARVIYKRNGNIESMKWYTNGDKIKEQINYPNGKPREIKYFVDGKYHRENGPAFLEYDSSNRLQTEMWYREDLFYRTDGPAITNYKRGKIVSQEWYINDKRHSTDGPAIIRYDDKGEISVMSFFIDGKKVTEKKFLKLTNRS